MKLDLPPIEYVKGPLPQFLSEASSLSLMQRLKDVGVHCGLQYTSFPYFQSVEPYSRYTHSLGVALISYHFSKDKKQALAGLFHDIATPAFSHVVDFLLGDPTNQEATERSTASFLRGNQEILDFLSKEGIKVEEVDDVKRYPLCDNAAPRLCADRVSYTLENFLHFHVLDLKTVQSLFDDLVYEQDIEGGGELIFSSVDKAKIFGMASLVNADMYTRIEDRYAMEALSRVLQKAVEYGDIQEDDIYLCEKQLIAKLEKGRSAANWKAYTYLKSVQIETKSMQNPNALFTKVIQTKRRFMDPYVKGKGRLSAIDAEFKTALDAYLSTSFDVPLTGISDFGAEADLDW